MDAELYGLMTELGRRGYMVHNYQLDQDGPLAVAAVLRRGTCADVLILHDEHRAYAYRTSAGADQDVLDPTEVMWDCPAKPVRALNALLALPKPGAPAAPTVPYPPQSGLCLPAAPRGEPMTMRRRGI